MTVADDNTLKMNPRTERRHEAVRNEVFEMHLVERNTRRERALCGVGAPDDERMGVAYYL